MGEGIIAGHGWHASGPSSIREPAFYAREGAFCQMVRSASASADAFVAPSAGNSCSRPSTRPQSEYGLNRTTWRIPDLVDALRSKGFLVNQPLVSGLIREGGYRWKKARVVLTSNDRRFREKLDRVRDEAFFSLDEFGPFAIRMRGGRMLVPP